MVIGGDTRESTPAFDEALTEGFRAEGIDVIRLGVVPTPLVAFEAQRTDAMGAMVSASHNPFHDNGIKLFAPGGTKLPDDVERRIEAELDALGGHRPGGVSARAARWRRADRRRDRRDVRLRRSRPQDPGRSPARRAEGRARRRQRRGVDGGARGVAGRRCRRDRRRRRSRRSQHQRRVRGHLPRVRRCAQSSSTAPMSASRSTATPID